MTLVSGLCLITYYHHGSHQSVPQWFIDWSRDLWGIEALRFHQHAWSHVTAMVLLMLVPLAICRLAGIRAFALGLSAKGARSEFLIVLGMWVAFVPVIWLVSETDAFTRVYPRLRGAKSDVGLFVAYETFYLVKWVAWEFFFRGFMLFGFKRDLGNHAVLISTIAFALMHFGKPQVEVYASLAAGFTLCWIALRARCIWPGVLLHWLVATSMDFFSANWWR